jgi:hypothetical protein
MSLDLSPNYSFNYNMYRIRERLLEVVLWLAFGLIRKTHRHKDRCLAERLKKLSEEYDH